MTAKRVLALIVMVVSVLMVVLLVSGIVGTWLAKGPVLDVVQVVFESTDRLLSMANDRLTRVNDGLGQAETRVKTLQENIAQTGADLEQNSLLLNLASQTVGEELGPAIAQVRDGVEAVGELIQTVDQTMQAINALPFVSLEVPGSEQVQQLSESAANLQTAAQELRTQLKTARAERIQEAAEAISRPLQALESGLAEAQSAVSGASQRVLDRQARLRATYEQIVFWINLLVWIVTVLLVLLILGQVALFLYAYSFYTGKDLLALYRTPRGEV